MDTVLTTPLMAVIEEMIAETTRPHWMAKKTIAAGVMTAADAASPTPRGARDNWPLGPQVCADFTDPGDDQMSHVLCLVMIK